MSTQILDKIFGSSIRVKIMKLFIFNSGQFYEKHEIERRLQTSSKLIAKELENLAEIGFIKKRVMYVVSLSEKNEKKHKKIKKHGFVLNDNFTYLNTLKNLLISSNAIQQNDLAKRINRAGDIKLIVVSGIFSKAEDSRADLLVVGDQIKDRVLRSTIKKIESDIGRELRYAVFSVSDFKYRYGICDRLIRDIFDYPHEVIVDKIGL